MINFYYYHVFEFLVLFQRFFTSTQVTPTSSKFFINECQWRWASKFAWNL